MVDEEARETVREIRNSIWKSARETYFKLKNDGRETYDLDVVFDNEEPPFPNHVFMSLASHFSRTMVGCLLVTMWAYSRTRI